MITLSQGLFFIAGLGLLLIIFDWVSSKLMKNYPTFCWEEEDEYDFAGRNDKTTGKR